MDKKKIYLLRETIDWHNVDADATTRAFTDKETAIIQLVETYISRINEFQQDWDYELYNINYETLNHKCSFRTERGDYYNLWLEEIELE